MAEKKYDPLDHLDELPIPQGVMMLVKEDSYTQKTAGGVVLPQISKDTVVNVYCTVLATGHGRWNVNTNEYENSGFEPGDRIFMPKVGCQDWENPDDRAGNYWFVNLSNVIAKMRR